MRSGEPVVAAAHYRVAELARLRGHLDAAETAYARAAAHGYDVQRDWPGCGSRRAAGMPRRRGCAARSTSRAATRRVRPLLLAAQVEIGLATGDRANAQAALAELDAMVGPDTPPFLSAVREHAAGAALLADGEPRAALRHLRRACGLWQELDVPYDAARTRLLVADACAALGDHDAATMETAAARSTLGRLGAVETACPEQEGPLSPRECEVLPLVATGVDEPRRRAAAGALREDRCPAREQHPRQARPHQPRGGDGVGVRARAGLNGRRCTDLHPR